MLMKPLYTFTYSLGSLESFFFSVLVLSDGRVQSSVDVTAPWPLILSMQPVCTICVCVVTILHVFVTFSPPMQKSVLKLE